MLIILPCVWLAAFLVACVPLLRAVIHERREARHAVQAAHLRRRARDSQETLALETQFRLPAVEPRR